MRSPHRRVAWAVTVVGGLVFVLLAAVWVPWDPVPGTTPPPAASGTVFTDAEVARAEAYASWGRLWSRSSLVVSLAVSLLLGFTRWGRRLLGPLAGRRGGPWWVRVPLAVVLVLLVGRLVTLPFAVSSRVLSRRYGLSEQAWPAYAWDLAVGFGVQVVATSVVLLVLLGVRRRLPRAWPAAAGVLLAGLVMAGSFVYPVVVEPLRNSFVPLAEGPLRTEILDVAAAEDVDVDEVLVADASRRTTTLNAYVSGFGGTRRVVVYDTLLDSAAPAEVLAVVAHELAHARHDDVLVGSTLGAAGAVLGAGLLGLLLPGVRRREGDGTDDDGALGERAEPALLVPRVLALAAVGMLLATPVQNTVSRQIELRADVDALCITGDPAAFEALQTRLGTRSLSDPTPQAWSQLVFGSHPTTLERVGLARGLTCP